jgi:hypothetical protein
MKKLFATLAALVLLFTTTTCTYALTPAQLTALKNDILADPELAAHPNTADGAFAIAEAYSAVAAPDFWVWRSSVSQAEIVGVATPAPDNTSWSWTTYIARSQGERDGWREMFADTGTINPSRPNVRQGLQDIFSGGTGAGQRTHLLAAARRKANRVEKLFATGTGSTASPATMGFEGALSYQDVLSAREN